MRTMSSFAWIGSVAVMACAAMGCRAASFPEFTEPPHIYAGMSAAQGRGEPDPTVSQWQAGAAFFYGSDFSESQAFVVEGEFNWQFLNEFVVSGRITYYQYSWDDGESLAPLTFHEEEDGSGFGVGAELRWYVSKRAFEWFFLGGGFALYPATSWENKEDLNGDGAFQANEIDDGGGFVGAFHGTIGVSIPLSPSASLVPTLVFGHYSGDEGPGPFIGAGVRLTFGPPPPGNGR